MPIFRTPSKLEYKDGELIPCQKCGRRVQVKWFANQKAVVLTERERLGLALRCKACGYITCHQCSHPDDNMLPICPSCRLEMGPYYFVSDKPAEAAEEPQDDNLQSLRGNWGTGGDAFHMDFPKTGGVTPDKPPEERSNAIRRLLLVILTLVLVIIVAGIILSSLLGIPLPTLQLPAMARLSGTAVISGTLESSPTLSVTLTALTPGLSSPSKTPKPSALAVTATPNREVTAVSPLTPTLETAATPTATLTPKVAPTFAGCVDALSVTLDDVGKTLCVQGMVREIAVKTSNTLVLFSDEKGKFYFVLYDIRPPVDQSGLCVIATGEVKKLQNSPVIVPDAKHPLKKCP
jgi:hypothetical protein